MSDKSDIIKLKFRPKLKDSIFNSLQKSDETQGKKVNTKSSKIVKGKSDCLTVYLINILF